MRDYSDRTNIDRAHPALIVFLGWLAFVIGMGVGAFVLYQSLPDECLEACRTL